jgi:hypothetical protein
MNAAPIISARAGAARLRRRGLDDAVNMTVILCRVDQRRRLPPPRELLLLRCPRSLAARVDLPLEYPENASERVPLLSVAVRLVPL